MSERQRPENHSGEEGFLRVTGEETRHPDSETAARPHDRGLGTDVPDEEKQDSGFFGAGYNQGPDDDNFARETSPGYQGDKWDRGTEMPG